MLAVLSLLRPLLFLLLVCLAAGARADVIVLVSDDKGAVASAARSLKSAYPGRMDVHNLAGSRARENDIVQAIQASSVHQVVAVGLLAAQVARQRLEGKQVVFCQVLNIEEFKLVAPWMKGVSGIPSLGRQFALWKLLDPGLRKVGLITGPYARYMLEEAEAAAKPLGLEIEHVEVSSDRAVLPALQELRERRIQGLWLAPDSSILSQRTILDVMAFSTKHSLQVLAFSPALLKEGALLSASADTDEIARAVLERLRRAGAAGAPVPGEAMQPLAGAHLSVSAAAAARFGLAMSPKLKEQADVQ
ncbi:MAG: ABC transporter substrate binding protein [Pseudomonadota bacterium]